MKKIEELEKDLNNGILENIYFLYGEEQYLLDTIVNKIKNDTNLSYVSHSRMKEKIYPIKLIYEGTLWNKK